MYGPALVAVSLAVGVYSTDVPKDVWVSYTRQLAMPLEVDPARQGGIDHIRLLVSTDRGKSWKYKSDHKPGDSVIKFEADHDGLYWLALQIEFKDGSCEPATLAALTPGNKVFVDTKTKRKPAKPYDQLSREVEELRLMVEQLQKRVTELEAAQKHNSP